MYLMCFLCLHLIFTVLTQDNLVDYLTKDVLSEVSVSSPIFGWNNTKRTIIVNCIPRNTSLNMSIAMFDWRYNNKKPIINGSKYKVNPRNGQLTIINPKQTDDNTLHCNVVGNDETVKTFSYNLMTAMPALFSFRYILTGYVLQPCKNKRFIDNLGAFVAKHSLAMLCQKFFSGCRIKFAGYRFYQDFFDETNDNLPGCLISGEFTYSEPNYMPRDCNNIVCIKTGVIRYLTDPNRVFWEDYLMARYYEKYYNEERSKGTDFKEIFKYVKFNRRMEGDCPPGYIFHAETICMPCPAGTKSETTNSTTFNTVFCRACPITTYQPKFHQTECLQCDYKKDVTVDLTGCSDKKKGDFAKIATKDELLRIAKESTEVDMELGNTAASTGFIWRIIYNKIFQIIMAIVFNALIAGAAVYGIYYYRKKEKKIEKKKKYEKLSQTEYQLINKVARLDMIRTGKAKPPKINI